MQRNSPAAARDGGSVVLRPVKAKPCSLGFNFTFLLRDDILAQSMLWSCVGPFVCPCVHIPASRNSMIFEWCSRSLASVYKWNLSCSCAAVDKILTDSKTRDQSTLAEFLVVLHVRYDDNNSLFVIAKNNEKPKK